MSKRNKRKAKKERRIVANKLNPFFTPLLNAALESIMRDPARPDTHRVWAWIVRNSHGEWSPYAVKREERPPASENLGNPFGIDTRMFGPGGCPLCHQPQEPDLPADFRWHRWCMELVYAGEAAACTQYREEMKWAIEVRDRHAERFASDIKNFPNTNPGSVQ